MATDIPECRFCKESTGTFVRPCNCRGSVGAIHSECLERWTARSGTDKCNVCNGEFSLKILNSGLIPSAIFDIVNLAYTVTGFAMVWYTLGYALFSLSYSICEIILNFMLWEELSAVKFAIFYCFEIFLFGIIKLLQNENYNSMVLSIFPIAIIAINGLIVWHHITFTGWTIPVIMMNRIVTFDIVNCLCLGPVFGWYRRNFIKKIYIDKGAQLL